MEALWGFSPGLNGKFCVSAIDDENTFIQHVVLAGLAKEETIELIASVLLVVSGRQTSDRWITASLNDLQLTALGMHLNPEEAGELRSIPPLGFVGEEDLARVFMEAPLPLCMLAGPEFTVTFINPAFVHIAGRRSEESLLGKPIREALHDLEGQQFFPLLEKVYRTGEPFVGVEVPAKLYYDDLQTVKESYFDFVYHPVRDRSGKVCGILCQATDVTERVLEKHVRESREEKLYRQWAELDAIYRESPVGMCLIDAQTLRLLRLNKVKAEILGGSIEDFVGRKITEVATQIPDIGDIYRQAIATKRSNSFEIALELPSEPGKERTFLWNLNPVFNSVGEVESLASLVMDITEWPRALQTFNEATHVA